MDRLEKYRLDFLDLFVWKWEESENEKILK